MGFSLPYADYVDALRGRENNPASLNALLLPFGVIGAPIHEDEFILIGHLLDALSAEVIQGEVIDASTVIELALDLGMSSVA